MTARVPSGFFTTPTNTPTGQPKAIAVDNPYLTKDEFLTNEYAMGLNITSSSPIYTSGRLDKLLLSASAQINRYCRRWFDTQTIDETKVGITVRPMNPQLVTVVTQNRPYQKINSIYLQVLKWFIQIDISQSGYLQDFPDYGYYKIVPLLSNSGTGAGSPMPAEIVDKTPLGVIWTNYTFGYGEALTAQPLANSDSGQYKSYQAPLYNRLWAPSQTLNIYKNGILQSSSLYSLDYANGIVTFNSALLNTDVVTADFTTNETVPQDIKDAVAMLVAERIGQGGQNALGADSYSIMTYSVTFGKKTKLREAFEQMLEPYQNNIPVIF